MVGTGFDKKIKTQIKTLFYACLHGLEEKIEKGLDPTKGLRDEFREISQYREIMGPEIVINQESRQVNNLFGLLEEFYASVLTRVEVNKEDFPNAVRNAIGELDKYIDRIEKTHKDTYGPM